MKKKRSKQFPICPRCKDKDRRLSIGEIWGNYLILRCVWCGHQQKDHTSLKDVLNKQKEEALK